jgi:hypothetical protein
MILAGCPALQKHSTFRIGYTNRNRAMPVPTPMRNEFRRLANFPIPLVNEDYQFLIHDRYSSPGRVGHSLQFWAKLSPQRAT